MQNADTVGLRRFDIAIAVAALAGYFLLYQLWHIGWSGLFWDFGVYQRAVTDAMLGENPYRTDIYLPFFYHPLVLYVFILLDRFIGLAGAFIGLYAAAALLFLFGSRRLARNAEAASNDLPVMLALAAAFSFGQAGVQCLISANMTLYLHLAFIGMALLYIHDRKPWQWSVLLAIILMALLVKPYFIIYTLPLLAMRRFSVDAVAPLALTSAAATSIYLLFWMFDRQRSAIFVDALHHHLQNGTDLGMSFFGLATTFLPADIAIEIHMALVAVLCVVVLFLRRLVEGRAEASDAAIFLLSYALIALCNPRMKDYDLIPAIACLYFYFARCGSLGRALILLSLIIAQVPLWVAMVVGAPDLPRVFAIEFWQAAAVMVPLSIYFMNIAKTFSNR